MAFDLKSKANINPHHNVRSSECRHVRHFRISLKTFRSTHRLAGLSLAQCALKISNGQIACQQRWRENFTSDLFLSSAQGWEMMHEHADTWRRGSLGKDMGQCQKVGLFRFVVWVERNQYPVSILTVLFSVPVCLDNSLLLQEAFGAVTYSFPLLPGSHYTNINKLAGNRFCQSLKGNQILSKASVFHPNAFMSLSPSPGTVSASMPHELTS